MDSPHALPSNDASKFVEQQVVIHKTLKFSWETTNVYIHAQRNEKYSSWRVCTELIHPSHIYVAFQKSSYTGNVRKTNMIFNHMNLTNLHAIISTDKQYPQRELICNFDDNINDYTRAYMFFLKAGNKTNNVDSGTIVNYKDFKKLYPIFHIDVSKYPDTMYGKYQVADITLSYNLGIQPTESYNIICIITSEKSVEINPTILP